MGGFSAFASSLANTLGKETLARQQEERQRQDILKQRRHEANMELIKSPAVQQDPGLMHDILNQMKIDLRPEGKEAAKSHDKMFDTMMQHLGSSREAWKQFAGNFPPQPQSPQFPQPGQPGRNFVPDAGAEGQVPTYKVENPTQLTPASPLPQPPASIAQPQAQAQLPGGPFSAAARAQSQTEAELSRRRQAIPVTHEEALAQARTEAETGAIQAEAQRHLKLGGIEAAKNYIRQSTGREPSEEELAAIGYQASGITGTLTQKVTSTSVMGEHAKASYPTDLRGEPTEDGQRYVYVLNKMGRPVGILPSDAAPSYSYGRPVPGEEPGTAVLPKIERRTGKVTTKVGEGAIPAFVPGALETQTEASTPKVMQRGDVQTIEQAPSSRHIKRTPVTGRPTPASPVPQQAQPATSQPTPASSQASPTPPSSFTPQVNPHSDGRSFWKPLPPTARLKLTTDRDSASRTEGSLVSLIENSGALDSLLSSGKIQLAISNGNIAATISKGVTLSPAEQKMAENFIFSAEYVNTLRGTSGATGFKGPDAFAKLQGLIGKPMANPEVSRGVMRLTLSAVLGQIAARDVALARSDAGPKARPVVSREEIKAYVFATNGDINKAMKDIIRAGYDLPAGIAPPK